MEVTVICSFLIVGFYLLGMALDVIGLYVATQFASKGKVMPSKLGYYTMIIGEILEFCFSKVMILIPLLLCIEIFKIV